MDISDELILTYPLRWNIFKSLSEVGQTALLVIYGNYTNFAIANPPKFLETYVIAFDKNMDTFDAVISTASAIGFFIHYNTNDVQNVFLTKLVEMTDLEDYVTSLGLSQEKISSMPFREMAELLNIPIETLSDDSYTDRQFYIPQILYRRSH